MRLNRILATTIVLWLAAAAVACGASDAHLGTWRLNGTKSKFAEGMGREVTLIYEAVGGKVKLTVDGVDHNASPNRGVWVGQFDGKFYPVKGNLLYDAIMFEPVNDRTNKITVQRDGKILWSGKSAVSRNGKSLVVTVSGRTPNGKKFKGKAVYEKG